MLRELARGLLAAGIIGLLFVFASISAKAQDSPAEFFARDRGTWITPGAKHVPKPVLLARARRVSPDGLVGMVSSAAARHGVPLRLAHGVARIESGYRCGARSRAGALGLMQVKPATARSVGVRGNLFDCATSIEAGMRYLKLALTRGGTGCAGVSLYNTGVYARPRCTAYGRSVMRLSGRIEIGGG